MRAKVSVSINGGEPIVATLSGKEASVIQENEIVLSTKSIMVSELVGREKQIYDYAYRKGAFEKEMDVLDKRHIWISCIIFFFIIATIVSVKIFITK